MEKKLKDEIIKLVEKSTIHGLPNIVKQKSKCVKLFWATAFFLSFAYCSYVLITEVIVFLSYDVNLDLQVINDDFSIEFPSVTFCNLIPLDYSKNESHKIVSELVSLDKIDIKGHDLLDKIRNIKKTIELNSIANKSFYSNSHGLNKMLLSCYFNNIPCNSSYFQVYESAVYGNCYKFDATQVNQTMSSFRAGYEYGLRLELYVGNQKHNPIWTREMGALVSIQNRSVRPVFSEEGLRVTTGMETNLMIDREIYKKLSKPFSNCIENNESPDSSDSKRYKDFFKFVPVYRQKHCILRCAEAEQLKSNKTFAELYLECIQDCPQECLTNRFRIYPSHSFYPTEQYSRLLKTTQKVLENLTLSEIKESIVSVNVFYESMSYTIISEKPSVSFETLLANIGGHLGLFLGTSILTLGELFHILLVYLRHKLQSLKIKITPKTDS